MIAKPTSSIVHHFPSSKDPRVNRQKKHQSKIFFLQHLRYVCGTYNWIAIEEFGLAKEQPFTKLLGLEHGIPSHNTFGEVYAAFSICFSRWVADLANLTEGEVIALT